jgi:hypothetical protein
VKAIPRILRKSLHTLEVHAVRAGSDQALALFSFPSLAAYEQYRALLRPLLPGSPEAEGNHQASVRYDLTWFSARSRAISMGRTSCAVLARR